MKWNKDGDGLGTPLGPDRSLHVEQSAPTEWVWFVVDEAKRSHEAEGFARTRAEAQRYAVAVATALGWLAERVLVAEWWEVQTRIQGQGPWIGTGIHHPTVGERYSSLIQAREAKRRRGCKFDRIVHVRRSSHAKEPKFKP